MGLDSRGASEVLSKEMDLISEMLTGWWMWLAPLRALRSAWPYLMSARRERKEIRAAATLNEGPVVLHGVIEAVQGPRSTPFVVVTIHQRRSYHYPRKGPTTTKWTEFRREVEALPFRVRLTSGEVVGVEPDKKVDLFDRLEAPVPTFEDDVRLRRAELVAGERVFLRGVLSVKLELRPGEGLYRDALKSLWVLRPDPQLGMTVSTEPPGYRFQQRANLYLRVAAAWAVALTLLRLWFVLAPLATPGLRGMLTIMVVGSLVLFHLITSILPARWYRSLQNDEESATMRTPRDE
jgi:hypothetical protein